MATLLLLALAPVLSHALQRQADDHLVEVCTAQGARWVEVDSDSAGAGTSSAPGHLFEHCPACTLHATDVGMPPAPLVLAMPMAQAAVPHLFLAAPRTLHAWLAAQPRAPPARG
jgi:hypothetical protein